MASFTLRAPKGRADAGQGLSSSPIWVEHLSKGGSVLFLRAEGQGDKYALGAQWQSDLASLDREAEAAEQPELEW